MRSQVNRLITAQAEGKCVGCSLQVQTDRSIVTNVTEFHLQFVILVQMKW